MFKITRNPLDRPGIDLRVEGRLTAEAVPDVLGLLASHDAGPLTLDLTGLTGVDAEGRSLLAGLRRRGHRLINPSPYIAHLLREDQA